MLRVRFAPSPTGFLHVGSARTFILNWLYARHNQGTMILRVDDTDVERNTEASLNSIFDGLRWLDLAWDEEYRQSERLALHEQMAEAIFAKGLAYRDFTPAHEGDSPRPIGAGRMAVQSRNARDCRARRATAAPPPASRSRCAFACRASRSASCRFDDAVYGEQAKSTADIEDFALLRSDGMPTYHLASCADDADLRISHIIRGQDHLTNTFKHVLIFEAAGARAAAVCAPAAAGRARRHQALQAQARAGGERHHLSRRRISAGGIHQFSVPAGLVAERRSRDADAPGID